MKVAGKFAVALSVLIGVFTFAQPASATTFCVPDFFHACPDNGTNVVPAGSGAGAKLENAMAQNGNDGNPDTVRLDSGTYVDPDSFHAAGSDDLTVIGNGRAKTFLTSSVAANYFVVDLNSNNFRHVTMKTLSIVIPEDFPNSNGPGSAVQSNGDDFESVDVINENNTGTYSASSAFSNIISGGNFTDIGIYGRNGAVTGNAFSVSCSFPGVVTIDGVEISNANSGVTTACPDAAVAVDRASMNSVNTAFSVANGGSLSATNALIQSGDQSPFSLYNSAGNGITRLDLDQVTAVATGDPSMPAIRSTVSNTGIDSIQVNVRNSIITGFQNTWELTAPTNPGLGDNGLSIEYSDFKPVGLATGDSNLDTVTGNINKKPLFAGLTEFHLSAASPAVDAGDPDANFPLYDLEGNGRPIDGDFDGTAVRDMGAYELNPAPPNCPADPTACAPKLTKVKFNYRAGKGGALRYRLSIKAKVIAVFKPVPKVLKGKKRRAPRFVKSGKKGANVIKLGRKLLKPGRYRLSIRAFNKTGDSSNVVIRKVLIRKPRAR